MYADRFILCVDFSVRMAVRSVGWMILSGDRGLRIPPVDAIEIVICHVKDSHYHTIISQPRSTILLIGRTNVAMACNE